MKITEAQIQDIYEAYEKIQDRCEHFILDTQYYSIESWAYYDGNIDICIEDIEGDKEWKTVPIKYFLMDQPEGAYQWRTELRKQEHERQLAKKAEEDRSVEERERAELARLKAKYPDE